MKQFTLYFVDPPPYEGAGAGEDHREWFSSLEEARKRFNHWKREIAKDAKNKEGSLFYVAVVSLARTTITPTKKGIIDALNSKVCAHEYLDRYPEPKEK